MRFKIVDRPTEDRKRHKGNIPRLGGVAVFLAFAIPTIAVLICSDYLTTGDIDTGHLIGFLLGGLILIAGGVVDDKFDLPPKFTVLFPIAAALTAALVGIGPSKMTNPFGAPFEIVPWISFVFTFVWLLGMIYTTKLLDGLDGLATGVTSIGTLMIAFLALTTVYFQPDVALLALIAFGALIGFMLWNFNPAQIFLGEGGSTFVGYLLGGLAIISGSKVATALLVVGIPALDVFFVMWQRFRLGKPIFTRGDRLHLHHKLYDLGFSQRRVVALYLVVAIVFGLTTLVFESWQKLIALGILGIIMIIITYRLSKSKSRPVSSP
ncbi:MAG: MraY family glycosyltransferase [bacterium]